MRPRLGRAEYGASAALAVTPWSWPGNGLAMCLASLKPGNTGSKLSSKSWQGVRSCRNPSALMFQLLRVVQGGPACPMLGGSGMDLVCGNGSVLQPDIGRHPRIAFRIVGGQPDSVCCQSGHAKLTDWHRSASIPNNARGVLPPASARRNRLCRRMASCALFLASVRAFASGPYCRGRTADGRFMPGWRRVKEISACL